MVEERVQVARDPGARGAVFYICQEVTALLFPRSGDWTLLEDNPDYVINVTLLSNTERGLKFFQLSPYIVKAGPCSMMHFH